jgi:RNA polymerase sigma-70 factor, ECF subfamily
MSSEGPKQQRALAVAADLSAVAADSQPLGVPDGTFIQLFTRSQRRIYLFILSQVGNTNDAEEILQDANVIVWSKYQQFQAGTNFVAWACQIAMFEIMKFRTRRKREKLQFSDEFVSRVAEKVAEDADVLETRRSALSVCLSKLRPKDLELIQSRYAPGENGKKVAQELGRPSNSVYQSLGRIRRALLECVSRRLAAEGLR